MTIAEFNERRAEIYQILLSEAVSVLKASMVGVEGIATRRLTRGQINAAKGVATRRFNKMEKAVYSV